MKQKILALLPLLFSVLLAHPFWEVSSKNKKLDKNVHTKNHVMQKKDAKKLTREHHGAAQTRHHVDRDEYEGPKKFILETNFGLYRPSCCILREIYGKNWINYQVKVSGSVVPHSDHWNRLHAWFAVNYSANSGNSINGLQYTKMQIVPLTFGLQFIHPGYMKNGNAEFHLGAGLRYYFVDIKNKSDFVDPCVTKSTLGGVIESGVYFLVGENIAFNLGLDYGFAHNRCSKKQSSIPNVKNFGLKLSGLTVGGGLGFRF